MDSPFHFRLERGSRPLHVAIADGIAAEIRSGRLAPGTRLPPERSLAESLGVSRMTVRQALGELEHDRRVRRVVGRAGGTFVCEPEEIALPSAVPTGLSAALRREGGASQVELISADVERAGRRTAGALGLDREEQVVVVTRLCRAGERPLGLTRSSLPARLFPGIEDMDLGGSLYDRMGEGFGLRPVRAVERLELTAARSSDARALGLKRDAPLLLVERTGYAADGTPVEYARDRFHPGLTRLVVEASVVGE